MVICAACLFCAIVHLVIILLLETPMDAWNVWLFPTVIAGVVKALTDPSTV